MTNERRQCLISVGINITIATGVVAFASAACLVLGGEILKSHLSEYEKLSGVLGWRAGSIAGLLSYPGVGLYRAKFNESRLLPSLPEASVLVAITLFMCKAAVHMLEPNHANELGWRSMAAASTGFAVIATPATLLVVAFLFCIGELSLRQNHQYAEVPTFD